MQTRTGPGPKTLKPASPTNPFIDKHPPSPTCRAQGCGFLVPRLCALHARSGLSPCGPLYRRRLCRLWHRPPRHGRGTSASCPAPISYSPSRLLTQLVATTFPPPPPQPPTQPRQSEGLKCYVEDFNHLIEDFAQFVKERRAARGLEGKKVFVIAQSMGGAIALLSTLPGAPLADVVDGLVLVAPMCAIAPGMRPPEWQISLLRWTAYVIPTWPITPTPDLIDRCYRDPAELEKAKNNPLGFRSKPRLLTALQMNDATERIEKRMPEVQVPFLVLHGTDDVVTAPEASKALHAKAASKDKSIKLYDGLWHALFSEPDGEGQKVTADTLAWIEERA